MLWEVTVDVSLTILDPIMLDIYDNVGVVVMDENRLLITTQNMLRTWELRNAIEIIPDCSWSFCSEADAIEAGGPSFREITYELDGSRPVLATPSMIS